MLDPVQRCQIAMAVVHLCVDIGDDDGAREEQDEFDGALTVLIVTPPTSLQDASDRLRVLACVGNVYCQCSTVGERVREGMICVASWLARTDALAKEASCFGGGVSLSPQLTNQH